MYKHKPITPVCITVCVCVACIVASACFVGVMWANAILHRFNAQTQPQITITGPVEYFHATQSDIVWESGVTPEGEK